MPILDDLGLMARSSLYVASTGGPVIKRMRRKDTDGTRRNIGQDGVSRMENAKIEGSSWRASQDRCHFVLPGPKDRLDSLTLQLARMAPAKKCRSAFLGKRRRTCTSIMSAVGSRPGVRTDDSRRTLQPGATMKGVLSGLSDDELARLTGPTSATKSAQL